MHVYLWTRTCICLNPKLSTPNQTNVLTYTHAFACIYVCIYLFWCIYVCSFMSRRTSGNFVSHFSVGKKSQKSALLPFSMAKLGVSWLLRILTRWVWFGWFSSRLGPSPQSLNESHIWMNEPHKRMTASHICDTDMNKSPMIRPFSWTDQQRNRILLPNHVKHTNQQRTPYWVATISRLLKIIYHFARISSFYRALLQKRPVIWRSTLVVATPYLELNESCHISPTLLSRHTSIQQRISFYDPHIDESRHKLR